MDLKPHKVEWTELWRLIRTGTMGTLWSCTPRLHHPSILRSALLHRLFYEGIVEYQVLWVFRPGKSIKRKLANIAGGAEGTVRQEGSTFCSWRLLALIRKISDFLRQRWMVSGCTWDGQVQWDEDPPLRHKSFYFQIFNSRLFFIPKAVVVSWWS